MTWRAPTAEELALPLNPFMIGRQREGEDQVTYAFACTLEVCGSGPLSALLKRLGFEWEEASGTVLAKVQESAVTSRPDARLEVPGHLVVLVESKVVTDALSPRQLRDHLDAFGSARSGVSRVMLAVTPDREPPSWWDGLADERDDVVFLHAAWSDVAHWADEQADGADDGSSASHLLRALSDLLVRQRLAHRIDTEFNSTTIARVEHGAREWTDALRQQHAAQEAFLGSVKSAFLDRVGEGIREQASTKLASRWGVRSWSPVSTYLDVRLRHHRLPDWREQRLWVEVFLATWDKPHRLQIRSGLLLEGRRTVLRWHGIAKDEAARAFEDRMWPYRSGSSYAEVWARRPFRAESVEAMREEVVADMLAWVNDLLPALRGRVG